MLFLGENVFESLKDEMEFRKIDPRSSGLSACFILILALTGPFYFIIWYDRFGTDYNRTFINRLVALTCRYGLEYTYFIVLTDALRFLTGPMPETVCFAKTILRSSYVTSTMICYNMIAVTKYLFIFRLKNPAAFKEDFWYFLTMYNLHTHK
jgi:hypothetical protein